MAGALTTGMMFGPFTITEQIGRGGMGVVYAAQHRELQRAVALKLLGNDFNDSAEYRRRFLREAVALGRIDSPHIVQVYDAGELDGQLFIATKLYPKGDLRQWLTANGPLAPELAIALMDQVASGLQDAHDAGVVHRDVKPSNILLDVSRTGELRGYLCDLGISRIAGTEHTRTVGVIDTLGYMAPERHRGEEATEAGDVYALGCVLYAMLTGSAPWTGTDVQVALAHIQNQVPEFAAADEQTQRLRGVILKAMAKDPADRHHSAEAFRQDLNAALGQAEVVTEPHEPVTKTYTSEYDLDDWSAAFRAIKVPRSATPAGNSWGSRWPTATDYVSAIQAYDRPLPRAGTFASAAPALDIMGMPASATGQNAIVFELEHDSGPVALRCFTHLPPDAANRYRQIDEFLSTAPLPRVAPVRWVDYGLEVSGARWPAVLMPWAPGLPLNDAVGDAVEDPARLMAYADEWLAVGANLAAEGAAHGDLQCGNVLVDESGVFRLVDLDGFYAPGVTTAPTETGHPNFQHPKRSKADWGPDVDAFSLLVGYLSLRALAVDPGLWRFHNGENLILTQADFEQPANTDVWRALAQSPDQDVRRLASQLEEFCGASRPPTLPQVLTAIHGEPQTSTVVLPISEQQDHAAFGAVSAGEAATVLAPAPGSNGSAHSAPPVNPEADWWTDATPTEATAATALAYSIPTPAATPAAADQWWDDGAVAGSPGARETGTRDYGDAGRPGSDPARFGAGQRVVWSAPVVGATAGLVAGLVVCVLQVLVWAILGGSSSAGGVFLVVVGMALAGALAGAGVVIRGDLAASVRQGAGAAALSIPVSLLSALVFYLVSRSGSDTDFQPVVAPAMAVLSAWVLEAVGIGVVVGLLRRSGRAVAAGVIGGLVGGALGGALHAAVRPFMIYSRLDQRYGLDMTPSAFLSVAIFLACVVIGLAIGLADRVTRRFWVDLIEGPGAGHEVVVDREVIDLGGVGAHRVRVEGTGDMPWAYLSAGAAGLTLNPQRPIELNGVTRSVGESVQLHDGDVIRVADTYLRIRTKAGV